MTETELALRASLAIDAADAEFVATMRLVIDARPLTPQEPDGFDPGAYVDGEGLARLVALAEETLRLRRQLALPPQIGPRGQLISVVAGDDCNRLIAVIEFDDEDALRAAGALIASPVTIERVFDIPQAANLSEPGPKQHGSRSEPEDEDS